MVEVVEVAGLADVVEAAGLAEVAEVANVAEVAEVAEVVEVAEVLWSGARGGWLIKSRDQRGKLGGWAIYCSVNEQRLISESS